jgi:hypothetical protein
VPYRLVGQTLWLRAADTSVSRCLKAIVTETIRCLT